MTNLKPSVPPSSVMRPGTAHSAVMREFSERPSLFASRAVSINTLLSACCGQASNLPIMGLNRTPRRISGFLRGYRINRMTTSGGSLPRLRKGVSVTDAEREIQSILDATLSNNLRPFFGTVGARISPRQTEQAADIRTSLYVLLGSSGLLLLIACGNVAAARRCPVRFAPKPFVDGRGNRDRNWSSYREWPLTRGIAVRSQHDRRRDLRWNNNGASRWRDSRRIPSGTPRCPMRSHDRSARGLVRRDGIEIGLGLWRHQVLRSGPAMSPSACYVNLR